MDFYIGNSSQTQFKGIKYRVKKTDTLQNLVFQSGFKYEAELRTYHNCFCPLHALLPHNPILKTGFTLYLPPHFSSSRKFTEKTPEIFFMEDPDGGAKPDLQFLPWKGVKQFDVNHNLKVTERKTINQKIAFSMHLRHLYRANGRHGISLVRKNYKLNASIPNNKLQKLLSALSSCLYPLLIETDRFGRFRELKQHQIINERWQAKKTEIQRHYRGEGTAKLLHDFEKQLRSKELLEKKLQQNPFITALCLPLYRNYGAKASITEKTRFYIKRKGEIPFNATYKLKQTEEMNQITCNALWVAQQKTKQPILNKPLLKAEAQIKMDTQIKEKEGLFLYRNTEWVYQTPSFKYTETLKIHQKNSPDN